MNVFDYFSNFKFDEYKLKREKFDDMFATIAEYLYRSSSCGIDLYEYNENGVSGQEIKFKNSECEKLFLLFVFLNSNGYFQDYIVYCLECEFLSLFLSNPSIELLVFHKLLIFVEKELACGYKIVMKKVAEISVHYCNSDVCCFCFDKYNMMT